LRNEIVAIRAKIEQLQKALRVEVQCVYPVGSLCYFNHSDRQVEGGGVERLEILARVSKHGYGTDIFIVNVATGKERRVDAASSALRPA
jgi:hypothetical protein